MPDHVLDTSALITVFQREPGADRVLEILDATAAPPDGAPDAEAADRVRVFVPFMALMELEYLSLQRLGGDKAREVCDLVKAWPVEVVESSEAWRREAARIKASFPLSVADAWIAGLATMMDAELVHKDPEYDAVDGLRSRRLPYKSGEAPSRHSAEA